MDKLRGRSSSRGGGSVTEGKRRRRPTVFGRLGLGLLLVVSALTGTVALGITTATPAFAAGTYTCTTPASGGTAVTFYQGVANSQSIVCYGVSGVTSTTAYPASITLNTGSLPAGAVEATSTTSSPACTTSTSGSGTTEHYILTCPLTDTPTLGQVGSYPVTFTANPGTDGGSATNSGTDTITVANTTQACIAPASGGTATTFYTGATQSYNVQCEIETHVSAQPQYPSSIAITSGALPGDANQTFATSTSSSPACTQTTSGSGATEEYVLNCALTATPTVSDIGSYPFTFTATGPPGTTLSGTLTVNVANPPATTTTCSAPAAGGTATTFTVGTAGSYSVTCYSQGFPTANAGNYPASITLASGSLPGDATEATSLTSTPPCTTATSGSSVTEEYELVCPIKETPTSSDVGTYPVTFTATGGANGAPNATSGTLTLTVKGTAPTFHAGQYYDGIAGVPFCFDAAADTVTAANGGLPLTSITLGTTPAGVTNYQLENVNLAAGTAQLCGTISSAEENTTTTMAPVFTNSGGSVTGSVTLSAYGSCNWTTSQGTTSLFDSNTDVYQTGSQSAFGAAITNGETKGTTTDYATCTDAMYLGAGLGGASTALMANALPTPVDTNPSASQGDLSSSNLELAKGCYGSAHIGNGAVYTNFGSASVLTVPSPWVNGGTCSYGIGSNSAGGNTDTTNASCPPSQADVNAGYVACSISASSGNNDSGANTSFTYSNDDMFFNGQPVPQQSTATMSSGGALPGGTLNVTGGTNWWGASGGAPNSGPYGDFQIGDMYQVSAPGVFIGTSRGTAVPVTNSTVTVTPASYVCTGAESNTVGPNPCTFTAGAPTGSFTVPSGLAPGTYNVYIDESNTTPLPGNGPNDSYQTARGTSLGTAESVTPTGRGRTAVHLGHVDQLQREQCGHLRGHRDRLHPDQLHRDRCPAIRGHPGARRHPVGHAGLRHRRVLPDHHHRQRRQLQHHHPGLHPDGDRRRPGVHLRSVDHLHREQPGHLRGDRQRGHPDRLHRERSPAFGGDPGLQRHPVGHA